MANAWRIENPWVWERYCNKTDELHKRMERYGIDATAWTVRNGGLLDACSSSKLQETLDASVNERYLFHGCRLSVVESIIENGFDERVSSIHALYGQGTYTTSQACKALQYARGEGCSIQRKEVCGEFWCQCAGKRAVFLCRVLLCDPAYTKIAMKGERRPPLRPGLGAAGVTYSSVVALPGVANYGKQGHAEVVTFDKAQIYPEYLLNLTWSP